MEKLRYPNKIIIKITPKIEDLLPNKRIQCPEPRCLDIFSNIGNLHLHLTRHHKINNNPKLQPMEKPNEQPNSVKLYFCPIDDCIYNENVQNGGRYFTNMKYIRQHYQKVHIAKIYPCSKCNKSFGTNGQQKAHETNCGKIYQCGSCDCKYTTKEALLTHTKRKQHISIEDMELIKLRKEEIENVPKIRLPPFKKMKFYDKSISNDEPIFQENMIKYLQPQTSNFSNSNLITLPTNSPYVYLIKVAFEAKDQECQTDINTTDKNNNCNETTFLTTSKCNQIITTPTINDTSNFNQKVDFIESEEQQKNFINFYQSNEIVNETNINNHNNNNLQILEENSISNSSQSNLVQSTQQPNFSTYYDDSCFDQLVNSTNFCDIETQTEFPSVLDQLLYSNTHTQTCDDFLQELGLADIQTQTNWSAISEADVNRLNNNNHCSNIGSGSGGAHDELLVSTETQTSFTQCLLECNDPGNSGVSGGITQHTQTCDILLDGLFDGQDFIGNFQSTQTQT